MARESTTALLVVIGAMCVSSSSFSMGLFGNQATQGLGNFDMATAGDTLTRCYAAVEKRLDV
jgi:hypothetical protein